MRLRENIKEQLIFFTDKWNHLTHEFEMEKMEIREMPLFKDILKKADTKSLKILEKFMRLLDAIWTNLDELNNNFFSQARPTPPNSLDYLETEPLREFPNKLHKILRIVYSNIDFKNETFQRLRKLVKHELNLEGQIVKYRNEYPLIKQEDSTYPLRVERKTILLKG